MNNHKFLKVSTVCAVAAVTLALGQTAGAVDKSETATPTTTSQAQATPSAGLKPLSADPIEPAKKPARGEEFVDPAYGTTIHRATDVSDGEGGQVRHEYSRRQAFNADNTRYIAQDGRGYWYLYDAKTYEKLEKLEGFAGDCEPIWHPSDPNTVYHTERNGGLQWWSYNTSSHKREVLFDFTGKTPWPEAKSFTTKSEGTTSADGRYLAVMATTYDEASQKNKVYGFVTVDLQEKKIVGTLDAKDFPSPGAMPDHISISPSGKYVVPSWLDTDGGTVSYTRDFSKSTKLIKNTEHSDLAFGPNKEDYFVVADYGSDHLVAINLDNNERINLAPLYPASGEAYALHVSGQAFDKPGWAVVSTYADSSDYTMTRPAAELRAEYRKVWLVELKPNGRKFNVAHVRANEAGVSGDDAYFLEPQATASRDLSKIIFASNFGETDVESYIVDVPEGFDK